LQQVLPGKREWGIFYGLLAATVFTTYLAGGWMFSFSLLLILGSHEFGHYFASRRNHVRATLPYFIPAPPVFIAGTFGAFIRIQQRIPDRRVLMEIGAAGPLTGFVVAVPVLWVGLGMSTVTPGEAVTGLSFGGSLILELMARLVLGVSPFAEGLNIQLHPVAFAGWIGMFVTALNLLPIGQLDGGHVMSAMFPEKYPWLARLFYLFLFPLGYFWPGWWFWALMITLVGGLQPAPIWDATLELAPRHRRLGLVSMVIFVLTFIPVPFQVS